MSPLELRRWASRVRAPRDDTLSRKATLNMVAAIIDHVARIVVGFLVQPFLVSRLGDVLFGTYQTLGRLIGYATPAGGRPSQALKWTIAREQHSDDLEEKRLQVGAALVVWLIFLPVLVVVGGAIAWLSPALLGLGPELHVSVRVAAALLVADLVLTNLLAIPQSVVQGENLGYKRMGASTLIVLVGGGLTVGAAAIGAGVVGVVGAVLTTTTLTGLLFLQVARRQVSWFGAIRPSRGRVWGFLKLSGWFLLWNLVMQLLRGSDVVVLATVGSPELVTVYALSRYVPEAIFGAVAIGIAAVMPGLGGLMGSGDTRRAATVRSESMTATWLLATATGTTFLLLQESFLARWVGPEYYPGPLASILVVTMILQFALIRTDASIIDLTLELRGKVLLGFGSAAVSIALAAFLVADGRGITGMALGFMAGRTVVSVAYPWYVARTFGLSPLGQMRGAIRPALASAVLFVAAPTLAPARASWTDLVVLGAVVLPASTVLSFLVGLSPQQRSNLVRRMRSVVGRSAR